MKKNSSLDIAKLLPVFSALFLIFLALVELNAQQAFFRGAFRGVSLPFGSDAGVLNTVASLIELAAGIVITATLFASVPQKVFHYVTLAVFIVWIARMGYFYIFAGFVEPDFLIWMKNLSFDAVFATVLWLTHRRA
jgi:hypothetical protein